MNKKITIGLTTLACFALFATIFFSKQGEIQYQPRQNQNAPEKIEGVFEYLNSLRANQITGVVDPIEVDKVLAQIQSNRRNFKAGFPLVWQNAGPDNIGGRTRAMLVDRNNPNILYAGGVAGGLFKSVNKGASWYPINDAFEAMTVSSICQTPNGTIYFGTGESQATGQSANETGTPGFPGKGIYKSTDGITFNRIIQTNGFNYVNKLAAHPTKNLVLAGTTGGLFVSDETDDTKWTSVLNGNIHDVIFDKNGVVYTATNQVFKSTNPSDKASYTRLTSVPAGGSRMALAVSASDPNYVYVITIGSTSFVGLNGTTISVGSALTGLYQSKDAGNEFTKVIGKASAFFAPFTIQSIPQSQGTYDLALAVHPRDRERVFIGGVEFAEWTPKTGPLVVANTGNSPFNPKGIHSDKHFIIFDTISNPLIMYISSDGGVAKTTNASLSEYTEINNGYQTTQFYGIAAGTDGTIIGGTQDQGTLLINGKGNTPQAGVRVLGGDGFKCEISKIDPKVMFGETYNSRLQRSVNSGGSFGDIFDDRITEYFLSNTPTKFQPSGIFNAPMSLFEDEKTGASRLYTALPKEVWMANDVVSSPNPQWFRIANIGTDPHMFDQTTDGSSLFVSGTTTNAVFRVDGLNKAVWDTTELTKNTISDSLTLVNIKGNLPSGRSVTDIEVDPTNSNRVIITLGNYGNSSYIYITENALDTDPTWRSIQGSLPNFPIYDAEISVANPDYIILGTEFGIYGCTNGKATTPTWLDNNTNFPLVPVFEIRQVEEKNVTEGAAWRTGPMIYAGTHGRGIFKSTNLLTSVQPVSSNAKIQLNAYPNPAVNQVSLNIPNAKAGKYSITIMNYSGQILQNSSQELNNGRIDLNTSSLPAGNYIIHIEGQSLKASSKFIKVN